MLYTKSLFIFAQIVIFSWVAAEKTPEIIFSYLALVILSEIRFKLPEYIETWNKSDINDKNGEQDGSK